MNNDNKQRLFEVMEMVDSTFKPTTSDNDPHYQIGAQEATINKVRDDLNRLLQYLEQNPPNESVRGFVQGILNNL